MKLIIK